MINAVFGGAACTEQGRAAALLIMHLLGQARLDLGRDCLWAVSSPTAPTVL